jgi:hypothetical protein
LSLPLNKALFDKFVNINVIYMMIICTLSNCCSVTYLDDQAFHRHIPILVRSLGSSCSELLHIISDPPKGSENLLTLVGYFPFFVTVICFNLETILFSDVLSCTWMMLIVVLFSGKVLEILTQETTPSSNLIATVKHLYETKLKVLLVTKISSVSYLNNFFAILVLM